MEQTIADYYALTEKMAHYEEALMLMGWDMRTGAPKKGIPRRSSAVGTLASDVFRMSTSEEMKGYIDNLSAAEGLDEKTKRAVEQSARTWNKYKNIPEDEYKAFVTLTSEAESAWEAAKEEADFDSFAPYLEKIVAYQRKYTAWKGYDENPYDALLDDFEPGLTTTKVDAVFKQLREALVPLVQDIHEKEQPEDAFLFQHVPAAKQEAFSRDVLQSMGYDFEAGRLDTTVHPFAAGLNRRDVRITTKYDEDDFRTAVFGTIHEGGHALYEQNIDEAYDGTPLAGGASMGIHESQSLFWENFVGRQRAFWEAHLPVLAQYIPSMKEVEVERYYRAVNKVEPSLIRIEADELTYCLHIIVRYELEKALINEELEVKQLPEAWNDKMEELLGVRPQHDGEGVLQDVHWPAGMFGYFPSYALGYIYAAQLYEVMRQDQPLFEDQLRAGELQEIKKWLTDRIHQHGSSRKPLELLHAVTGSDLDAAPLIRHLTEKYTEVYELDR
ncbi:carboxypeptidase M32 [Alkalicoccus chagannorensis]|uniref:carboxypeptidase M32 n=1 Tax=Alkalicoccus chagannorensis TaxID=427072 RepID=UPI000416CDF6|nr:carboxypeptidase M32 [Alkalicoccus chagannorensis]